jgi:hypothetical protein
MYFKNISLGKFHSMGIRKCYVVCSVDDRQFELGLELRLVIAWKSGTSFSFLKLRCR